MGQLYQVNRRLVWLLATAVFSAVPVTAQSYCSLTVRVLQADGQRADAPVTIEEKGGRTERRRQGPTDALFCDLGALPVSVKVGLDGTCNQVVVRNVPVAWNMPIQLTITYDVAPCLVETPPPPSPLCRIVFRVADAAGRWVPGIPIRIVSPMATVLKGDEFGRASFVAKLGDHVAGSIEARGYESVQFRTACDRLERVHEEQIRLTTGN